MGIYGENPVLDFFCVSVGISLFYQEVEEACRYAVARHRQCFWMELDAPYRIFPGRFNGFGDAVAGPSSDLEAGGGLFYCLMVVRIGKKLCLPGDGCHCRTREEVNSMGRDAA